VIISRPDRKLDCNVATLHMFGYRRKAEFLAVPRSATAPPRQPDGRRSSQAARDWLARAARDGHVTFEWVHRRKDGTDFPAEVTLAAFRLDGYELVRANVRDLTERRRIEAERAASEARFRHLAESHPIALVVTSVTEDRFLYVSDTCARLYRMTRAGLMARRPSEFFVNPEDRQRGRESIQRTGAVEQIRVRMRRGDGTEYWGGASGRLISFDGVPAIAAAMIDLTDQVAAEKELVRQREAMEQSSKMAAMGSLLASVSHELNNPLAVVMAQAELLREPTRGTPTEKRATMIRAAAERCARIVRTFLALARQKPPERRAFDLNGAVRAAVELLGYGLRNAGVALRLDLAPDLPALHGDVDQMAQVLSNLMLNAQQAMLEQDKPRRLAVATKRLDGGRVRLRVTDSGPGVPAALRGRVFEPFFTTKPVGTGTGIGLALCDSIITAHGGSIAIDDAPGGGARFTVLLPVQPSTPASVADADIAMPDAARAQAILVVDDEPQLLASMADILAPLAERIDCAANGREALELIARNGYDAILSDLRMPDIDGPALYARLARERPELLRRLVFVSGDSLGAGVEAFLRECGAPLLDKPFSTQDLRRAVAQVLGSNR
jgi:PAS domain S-box-containing protein